MSAYRHTRQVRLAEIGEDGQARLHRATVAVRAQATGGVIEARYLAGAGVGALRVHEAEHERAARSVDAHVRVVRVGRATPATVDARESSSPFASLALDPAAFEVAIGAWNALDAVRTILRARHGDAAP